MNKTPHTMIVVVLAIIFNTSVTFAYENPSPEQEVQATALTVSSSNECQIQVQEELKRQRGRMAFKRTVNTGDIITMQYIVRLSDGTLVDTSSESIAKACGLYNEKRDYNAGISFKAGDGALIKGVDQWIIGMRLNSSKNIKVLASQAYGEEFIMGDNQIMVKNSHPLAGKDLIFDITIRRIKK